jgi:hypothetical protein
MYNIYRKILFFSVAKFLLFQLNEELLFKTYSSETIRKYSEPLSKGFVINKKQK